MNELLELTGLTGRENEPVKNYSHGMKQRLGIAQTLLHNPEMIILDEPTTGLDPQGIIDVRQLILRLKNDFGKTVFLSSHLLYEVEQIADSMAIIHAGSALVQGKAKDLLSSHHLVVNIEVNNGNAVRESIRESRWAEKLSASNGNEFSFSMSKNEIPDFTSFLHNHQIHPYQVQYRRTLEDYFLKLTEEGRQLKNSI
jgi:ABC-2 type transport system ATP-binding protein